MRTYFDDLQTRVVAWHKQRFPFAKIEHVGLKLGSESGEVQDAINGQVGTSSATGKGDILDECADVLISLMVITGRWEINYVEKLLEAVERKMVILETPGKHPASIQTSFGPIPIEIDSSLPFDIVELRNSDGIIVGTMKMENKISAEQREQIEERFREIYGHTN